jgi:hypothetical protein
MQSGPSTTTFGVMKRKFGDSFLPVIVHDFIPALARSPSKSSARTLADFWIGAGFEHFASCSF